MYSSATVTLFFLSSNVVIFFFPIIRNSFLSLATSSYFSLSLPLLNSSSLLRVTVHYQSLFLFTTHTSPHCFTIPYSHSQIFTLPHSFFLFFTTIPQSRLQEWPAFKFARCIPLWPSLTIPICRPLKYVQSVFFILSYLK